MICPGPNSCAATANWVERTSSPSGSHSRRGRLSTAYLNNSRHNPWCCILLHWLPTQPHGESLMGMFARYLKYSRQTIVRAKHEADRFGSPEIDPEHILLALLNDPVLTSRTMQGISEKEIVMTIRAHIPGGERNPLPHDLELSKTAREALVSAEREADKLGHRDIRNEHILLGLVESGNSFAAKLLTK